MGDIRYRVGDNSTIMHAIDARGRFDCLIDAATAQPQAELPHGRESARWTEGRGHHAGITGYAAS
ncbi:hypothetical protein [Nocardia sp. CA-290969]|uniref:hypothetical protein n=1 Tax=Nocardia sp. CA-290969 TaxID=3239986 RepID=UPI003D8DAD98